MFSYIVWHINVFMNISDDAVSADGDGGNGDILC